MNFYKVSLLVVLFSLLYVGLKAQCNYSIVLYADWDGWYGSEVTINVAGTDVGTYTVPSGNGPETFYFVVNTGNIIYATFTAATWEQGCEYYIYDADGNEIYSDGVGGTVPIANNTMIGAAACPSCPSPINLGVTNVTDVAAQLYWTESGSATNWNVEYGLNGYTQGTGTQIPVTTNPYLLTGLTPQTNYDFYIQADCGAGDYSTWVGPIGFTTNCSAVMAPYSEDFENGGAIPTCWVQAENEDFDWSFNTNTPSNGTGPESGDHTSGAGYFAFTEASNPNSPSMQADLLTPMIDVSGLTIPALTFWYNMNGANMGELHVDVFDGVWHNDIWVLSGDQGDVWDKVLLDLSSYNNTLQIRFRGITGTDYQSDIAIDDILVDEMPSCPEPTALNVSNILVSSADLSWTEIGSATIWNIELGIAGFTPTGVPSQSGITANPYTYSGLTGATIYEYYVQSDCGGGDLSIWAGPFSFTTVCPLFVAPYLEDFESGGGIPVCWNNDVGDDFDWEFGTTTPSPNTGPQNGDHTTGTGYFAYTEASNPNNPNMQADLITPEVNISALSVPSIIFWYNMFGTGMGELHVDIFDGSWHNDIWTINGDQGDVWSKVIVDISAYTSPVQVRFRGVTGTDYMSDMAIDDVLFGELPPCPEPIDLAVSNITDVSADLSWTEFGTATTWNIEYGISGYTQGSGTLISAVTNNPYTLTGLNAATTYDYYVQADCGLDQSIWVGPLTFSTSSCDVLDQCTYNMYLLDDLGDGWNGASLTLIQDGISLGDFTLANGDTLIVPVVLCEGSAIDLVWNSGTYDYENGFEMYDAFNQLVTNFAYGAAPAAGSFYSFISYCTLPTCPAPVSLYADNITMSSADLHWTESGSATNWNLEYGPLGFTPGTGTTITGLNSNPYNITGLIPQTEYDFYVQADCGGGDTSYYGGPKAFMTLCDAIVAPYTEDFENTGNIPVCWINQTGDDFDWSFGVSTPTAGTGPEAGDHTTGAGFFAYTEASNPNNPNKQADLLSPFVDLSALTNPFFTFYYNLNGTDMGELHIDVFDGSWHNDVFSIAGNLGDVWTEGTINLSSYSSPVQLRFRGITGGGFTSDMAIDDVSFDEMPSCPDPSVLEVNNITNVSVDLSWIENGFAINWNIEYGSAGFTLGTGTQQNGISTNPYTLTGLTQQYSYDLYLQSDCGGGDYSNWIGPISFTTLCSPVSAPYFEDFENGGVIPTCWVNDLGDYFDWEFATTTPSPNTGPQNGDNTSGSGFFAFTEATSPNNPNRQADLLSPLVDVSSLTSPAVSFYYNMYGVDMGNLHVDVFDGVWHNDEIVISGEHGDIWTKIYLDLSGFSSPVQIRFRGITGADYTSDMAIDDIDFNELPTCPEPSILSAINITENSADVSWFESGSALIWNIEYGLTGFSLGSGTLLTGITSNPYTIMGLAEQTSYDFYVQADCGGGDISIWSGPYTFTTYMVPLTNPSACEINMIIPDDNCIDIPIDVSGLSGFQLGTDIELSDVNIIIAHNNDGQLSISLESPGGQSVDLSMNNGGNGNNYGVVDGTCTQYTNFNMSGVDGSINAGAAPFLGSYIPEEDMNNFNDGTDPNGYWVLRICDNNMNSSGSLEFVELEFESLLPSTDIIINEIDVDQTGLDALEFIELYDGGFGNYPLNGHTLVLYNGLTDQSYQAFDLDGYATDANGYFVIGNAGIPNVDLVFSDNILQNGADAVALYIDNASSFPTGTAVTTLNLSDAIVYGTDDPIDIQLLTLLNMGQPQVNENNLGYQELHSCARLPNGTGGLRNTLTYNAAVPTPHAENAPVPILSWSGYVFTEALVNDGSISGQIDLQLQNDVFAVIGLLTETIDYNVQNVPAGLTVNITVSSDSMAVIAFTGNAISHLDVDDISNMEILFLDNAFNTFSANYVIGSSQQSISVDFFDSAPPTLDWSQIVFNEALVNDGSIGNTVALTLYAETFTLSAGLMTESQHYTVANVPLGLAVEINVISNSIASIDLTGNAGLHKDVNDINDLEIVFLDNAFTGGVAANIAGNNMSDLEIDFMDPYPIDLSVVTTPDTLFICDLCVCPGPSVVLYNEGPATLLQNDSLFVNYLHDPLVLPFIDTVVLNSDLAPGDSIILYPPLNITTFGIYDLVSYLDYNYDTLANNDTSKTIIYSYDLTADLGGINDTLEVVSYPYTLDPGSCASPFMCTYVWSTTQTTQTIDVNADGWYSVSVTDNAGCVAWDSVYVLLSTGAHFSNNVASARIFPNPTSGLLNVEYFGSSISDVYIEIMDYQGKKVYKHLLLYKQLIDHQIDLSRLAKGMYFVVIRTDHFYKTFKVEIH